MPKRPDTLETVQLALELLKHIPKGRTITAPELHAQLEDAGYQRDLRSIQRMLETLSEHFDIERDDRAKPYRYRWKEQAKGLSLPGLSAQESLLLTLAEQQLSHLLPAKLMNAMKGFFEQARGTLSTQANSQRERQWLDKIRVVGTSQPLLPPKIVEDVFLQVSNALYANELLDVQYQNAAGRKLSARVMPLGLAQQGPRMYLVCRFESYDNERSLALHRIESAKATGLPFDRPKEFNFKQFDDDGRFAYGNGKKIRLRFRITKDAGLHIVECPLSLDQTVKETAKHYDITATVVDSAMLDWWLRGFGDAVSGVQRIGV
jgi:predicted DNA-binding transcriptional regulator YafY